MILARLAALALTASVVATAQVVPNPMDSIRKLPGYRDAHDSTALVSPKRIAALPVGKRHDWERYVARSHELHVADSLAMAAELRVAGKSAMTRAPYTHGFAVTDRMTAAWFATDTARRMVESILSFQAPNGGWSKHVDFSSVREPGVSYFSESADWEWISTIDNDATTAELRFLARADNVHHDARYAPAIARGTDYLLESQYPNGCLPQIYPLQGSYHDAATFNDNAMVNVLTYLREVSDGANPAATAARRAAARKAVASGIECILDAQISVAGRLVGWAQQHDPFTFAPVPARTYELVSITAQESAEVANFLMSILAPSDRVVRAVYAAVSWLESVPITGYAYSNYELRRQSGAGPLWGRLYEIGTDRIMMANRDGIKLYDWNMLTDRRSGYAWYTTKPAETIAVFKVWSQSHSKRAAQ